MPEQQTVPSTTPRSIYRYTLKTRYSFTDKWIKRLGEADKRVPNTPHYSGPHASLYLVERVETIF